MGPIFEALLTLSLFSTVGNMFCGFLSVHLAAFAADLKSRSSFSVTDSYKQLHVAVDHAATEHKSTV